MSNGFVIGRISRHPRFNVRWNNSMHRLLLQLRPELKHFIHILTSGYLENAENLTLFLTL